MGWGDYGGVGYASGAIGVYGEDRPQVAQLEETFDLRSYDLDVGLSNPTFLDQTPPVPAYVSETATVVSKTVGFDTTTVSWTSSKDFQAYRFEQVANATDQVFSGTLLASGATGTAGAVNTTAVTGESMAGADGTDTIKIFVQDFAGNWST